MGFPIDITGKQVNYLTALRYSHKIRRRHYWVCICKCGVEKVVGKSKLLRGAVISCGCQKREATSKARKIHGMTGTRFYGIWNDMIMRCYNPNKDRYPCYGGRGIKVDDRWRIFDNFYQDMFPTYQKGLSLERERVNEDYSRSNCKWIPLKEQALNRQNTKKLIIDGTEMSVNEASLKYNLSTFTIYARISKGWSGEDCVKKPSHKKGLNRV